MTKLSEIIDAATRDDVSVASLLRMVKVVASRVETVELDSWVSSELGGYAETVDLPPYRGPFQTEVMGRFSGPFGSEFSLQLPALSLPKDMRRHLFEIRFQQPILELETLAKSKQDLQSPWPANVVAIVNRKISDGEINIVSMHGLSSAYRVVTSAQIVGVVDTVKTRVLNLALDLEKLAPNAGEANASPTDHQAVTNIVTNNIYGGSNNLAVLSGDASQTVTVAAGDLAALLEAVAAAGLKADEIQELEIAIHEDEAESSGDITEPGRRVRDFLGRQALRAGSVSGKVGIAASGGVVAASVRNYYGLP